MPFPKQCVNPQGVSRGAARGARCARCGPWGCFRSHVVDKNGALAQAWPWTSGEDSLSTVLFLETGRD